ncbi:hypothetical protein [Eubacterium aggregans]|uniref:hypothetical protein n=1 Tax=Eubacterium aggregans TaxID=81409 RepID=UPI003F325BBC
MDVATTLHDAGFDAYMVGGAVHDLILEKESQDYDVTTNASYEKCTELFGDKFYYHYVGEVAYDGVRYPDDPDNPIDLAKYAKIPEVYLGQEGVPADTTTSLLTDSFQRDLTYNALYYNPFSGEIIDYHGGFHDIREEITDTINNPELQYATNPTTCLRTLHFTA